MKLTLYTNVFLLILLNLFSIQVKGQALPYLLPVISPKAPNTAALEKYGDYQVSMFSGLPTISIPLYTIQTGDLKVPISLDYHASGIRVSELASWAGLGWSLSAGGQISRKIRGLPDETDGSGYLHGNLRNANLINTRLDNDLIYLNQVRIGNLDAEPDIFSYSFPGKAGKFFFNGNVPNYPVQLIPFAPIKISRHDLHLNSFSVQDEHGNSYQFGTQEISTQYASSSQHVNTWMLDNMLSQNRRDSINFAYKSTLVSMPDYPIETILVSDMSSNYSSSSPSVGSQYKDNPGTSTSVSENGSNSNEQRLAGIFFKNGKVVFDETTTNRQDLPPGGTVSPSLNDIKIFRYDFTTKSYVILKTIVFYQSYFINATDATVKRLRLDSIGILDNLGKRIQHYVFLYNNAVVLPSYTSLGQDYWGYYNGLDNQNSRIPQSIVDYQTGAGPTQTITIGSNQANGKDPNPTFMQACMLQRIYYPTGGYTDFQFQPNQYLLNNVWTLAGGLRVVNIKSYDGVNSLPLLKSYQYSDARPNFFIQNYFFTTNKTANFFSGVPLTIGGTQRRRSFVSTPNVGIESWDAIPVTYSTVTEFVGDGITNAGKTLYRFSDFADQTSTASSSGKLILDNYSFRRGNLLSKSIYAHNSDGNYRIVESQQMEYSAFAPSNYFGVGLSVSKHTIDEGDKGPDGIALHSEAISPSDENSFNFASYDIYSGDNYLTSKSVTNYDQLDPTKSINNLESYYYDNILHQQVSRQYKIDSKGNTLVSTTKYPADFLPVNTTTTGNIVLDSMLNRNMQADVIEKWDSLKYFVGTPSAIVSGQLTNYKFGSMNAVLENSINKLNLPVPAINFTPAKFTSGQSQADSRYEQLMSFDQYDASNNLIQYTPRNATPTSIIWDYNSSVAVAEIKNSALSGCAYTSFEADGKGNWIFSGVPTSTSGAPSGSKAYNLSSGRILSPALNPAKAYTVSYWSTGAPASITCSNATNSPGAVLRTSNGWTYYLHSVPAGATSLTLVGSATIDELRLYPADALMTSYTVLPGLGTTTLSDAKGQLTYYDYDSFQRLQDVKDQNQNILKRYAYSYRNTVTGPPPIMQYFNAPVTNTYQRTGCGSGSTGSYVSYSVPAQKYTSTLSQADADQQATTDLFRNGTLNANALGTCMPIYYNAAVSQSFTKNSCGVGYSGSTNTVTVNVGQFSSLISQADANQQAQNYLTSKGQSLENQIGTCPNGTDVSKWQISYLVSTPTTHTVQMSVTKPSTDIGYGNQINYRIQVLNSPDLTGSFSMPSGVTSFQYNASFSILLLGQINTVTIDSIN